MNIHQETVTIHSNGATLAGVLFLPVSDRPSPALVICHGALEFKEDYFELCEFLAEKGVAALAIDMHGHGQSEGERFHVDMRE
jgi:alpha-beta hydrolase superfamily lysophospholipase